MQTNKLIGIWKLESNAGKQPADFGVKTGVIKFKADGTFIDVIESLSPVPGLVPERITRLRGAWKLDGTTLERTVPEGSFVEGTSPAVTHKSMIAVEMVTIDGDTLEIADGQHHGIFVYKRVNTS